MLTGQYTHAVIKGIASAVPNQVYSNVESAQTDEEKKRMRRFLKTTGVESVYSMLPGQNNADLCQAAAEQLLDHLGWERESVNAVLMVTPMPSFAFQATACLMQHRLGLSENGFAFDINQSCAGYNYGLHTACALMGQGSPLKRALVLAGDYSRVNVDDILKPGCKLFGEAGTATAIEFCPEAPPITWGFGNDGGGYNLVYKPRGGSRYLSSLTDEELAAASFSLANIYSTQMDGKAVFDFTITKVADAVREFYDRWSLTNDMFDAFALHQANSIILQNLTMALDLPPDRVLNSMKHFGNTTCASVPLAICDNLAGQNGELSLFCCGYGTGLSWNISTIKIDASSILPVFQTDFHVQET